MGRKKATEYESPVTKFINWCKDDRVKFVFALLLVLTSILMLIGFISFLFTWKEDQSKFEIGMLRYLGDSDILVENWGSKFGAALAQIFIHNLFGIPSFSFIFLCALSAFKILKFEPVPFWKTVKNTIVWTVWSSVFLAFLFGDGFFFLGGVFGYETDYWLESILGKFGTLIFLLIVAGTIILMTKKNSMNWVKIFIDDFTKHKNLKSAIKTANLYAKSMTESQENKIKNPYSRPATNATNNVNTTDYVYDEDEGGMLNSPINSAVKTETENSQEKKSPISFIKNIFKGDDSGVQQKIPFENIEQKQSSDNLQQQQSQSKEHFVLTDDGKQHSIEEDTLLDFDVEDTTKKTEEYIEPQTEVNEENHQEGEVSETSAQPTENQQNNSGDSLALEVETNKDVALDYINSLPPYDPTKELSDYKLPPVELLNKYETSEESVSKSELIENKTKIVEALKNFKIKIDKIKASIGPTVTLYEIVPAAGIRVSKIKNLEDDIQLSLEALGIRIIAPMPGKGTVGIEVPNKKPVIVSMSSLIVSPAFQNSKYELPIALGKTISNECFVMDLTKCPHLLVAGATGQGKSVGLNAIIASILYKKHPAEVKFVLVDPKKVELTLYNNIEKHYLAKLPESEEAIITDVDKVKETLNSLTVEMTNRYDLLKEAKVRNIKEYNAKFISRRLNPENGHRFLPYIVVIIDEFADLIMTAGKEIEKPIARIAQLARAIGIHLIVATQRPTTNIITGLIKANFPTRIAFKVSSMMDSRTILDCPGANHLIGRGDMLISNGSDLTRLQCAFIDTPELEKITEFIGSQRGYPTTYELPEPDIEAPDGSEPVDLSKRDSLFEEAAKIIVLSQQGSTSMLQRKLEIGYNRAGRIMDQLEAAGIVGPNEGSKARSVNIDSEYALMQFLENLDRSL
ncbi:MAG: DNA translocase FtsK [Bacteroidales bacterium]|nr:DNA translocase FtsK [Bacteroidales bacterium]MBR6277429.1 DNA translocase FtsK [Bacteroidales bacterium]